MDTFLGRALTDPATGFPNLPYFSLIEQWERRKADRRNTIVTVIRAHVVSGSDELRLRWRTRVCQEMRTSDLIASSGRDELWMLLTSPDAENADVVAQRIEQIADVVNRAYANRNAVVHERLTIRIDIESPAIGEMLRAPLAPCDAG